MNHKTVRIEIARTLYDWTVSSKNRFIDNNDELVKKAEKWGMKFPNPDLALMETIYCELDVYNRNGAMLPKEVAEKGLDTIIGKQINFEHEGAGHICGYIIDARIENNFIIIDTVLFKSVWREEFEQVKKSFEDGKLFVSFELWNSENGISILKILADGKKIVEKLIAHGCGLLMKEKPACPKAKVFKLLASEQLILASEKIDETSSKQDEKLSYAELSIKEECKNCDNCPNERRTTLMAEEVIKSAEVPTPEGDKCEVCGQSLGEGQEGKRCPACVGVGASTDATKASAEVKSEEMSLPVPEVCKNCGQNLGEGQEGDFCPACVVFEQEFATFAEVLEEASIPAEVLKRMKELRKEGKSMKEAMKQAWKEQKEKAAEVEKAHLDTMKHCSGCGDILSDGSEGELCGMCNLKHQNSHLQEACDSLTKADEAHKVSYAELNTKHEILTGEHTELQKQLQEIKDKYDALIKEQENAKQELGKKDQEIADLKIIKAKAEIKNEQPTLTVGSVDSADGDMYKEIRDKVDQKAYGAKSLGAK